MSLLKKIQEMLGMAPTNPLVPCEEVLERLFEFLDDEMPDFESQQVRDHLEVCKRCYPRVQFERTFLEAVQKVKSGEACPDSLRHSVLAAIRDEPEPVR